MRVSVLDAGSNTVRLAVVDVAEGVPLPVHTVKWKLRLSERIEPDGSVGADATRRLVDAVSEAVRTARNWDSADPLAFATAVVRHAPNRTDVLRAVREECGIRLCTLRARWRPS